MVADSLAADAEIVVVHRRVDREDFVGKLTEGAEPAALAAAAAVVAAVWFGLVVDEPTIG